MRILQEAHRRGIPPEHLNLDIPGAEDAYREMLGEVEQKGSTKVKLPPGSTFALNPPKEAEKRSIWYIAGASGSGKSHIAKRLAEEYQKQFPERDVYLISKLTEDETLDSMTRKPIRLNPVKLVEKPVTDLELLRDSLVIFDDYDTFVGKEGKVIQQLIDDIGIMGRHQNITMLCLTHYLSNYKKTRLMLTEATHFVLYPQSTGAHALNYLLKTYLGLGPKEVAALKKTGSRWVCIHKNFPIYYICETEAGLLNED
jgi:Cdc6-like AAA superfamily ATPase